MPRPPSMYGPQTLDLRPTPVVLRLILINGALWLLSVIALQTQGRVIDSLMHRYLMVSPDGVVGDLYLWQPFTYMWFHDTEGLGHIAFNLLALFFLGPPLERRWGRRTFLRFYLLSGFIAGLFTVLVGLLIPSWFAVPTLGASGAILALVAAFSMVHPDGQVLIFFVIPMRARYLVAVALGIDVLMFLVAGPATSTVAIHTHFGGALAGWLLITGNWRPQVAWFRLKQRFGGGRPPKGGSGRSGGPQLRVIRGGRDDRTLH